MALGEPAVIGRLAAMAAVVDEDTEGVVVGQLLEKAALELLAGMAATVDPKVQQAVAGCLTSLARAATPEQTRLLCAGGAVTTLAMMVFSTDGDVREQTFWALGYIAAASTDGRDAVDGAEIIDALLSHADAARERRLAVNGSGKPRPEPGFLEDQGVKASGRFAGSHNWGRRLGRLAAALASGGPAPDYEKAVRLLPLLAELLEEDDTEVLQHVLVPLAEMSAGSRERIRAVVQARGSVVPRLARLLTHPVPNVRALSLTAIANICSASAYVVTGDDSETQAVLDAGVLPLLLGFLHGDLEITGERLLIRRAVRVLANICAGPRAQLAAVVGMDKSSRKTPTGRFFPLLLRILRDCDTDDMDIVEEVVWVFANASHGADRHLEKLVADGCVDALYRIFELLVLRTAKLHAKAVAKAVAMAAEGEEPEIAMNSEPPTDCTDDEVVLVPALEGISVLLRATADVANLAAQKEVTAAPANHPGIPVLSVTARMSGGSPSPCGCVSP